MTSKQDYGCTDLVAAVAVIGGRLVVGAEARVDGMT